MYLRLLLLGAVLWAEGAAAQAVSPTLWMVRGEAVLPPETDAAPGNAERQKRREALRSALRSQGDEGQAVTVPRQLSPQERAELREQLRRQAPEPGRSGP